VGWISIPTFMAPVLSAHESGGQTSKFSARLPPGGPGRPAMGAAAGTAA